METFEGGFPEPRIAPYLYSQQEQNLCQTELTIFPLNGTTNFVYVAEPEQLDSLYVALFWDVASNYGAYSKRLLNWDVAFIELKLNASVSVPCPTECQDFNLQLVYRESTGYKAIVIQWELQHLIDWKEITISQIPAPKSGWFIYITQTANSSICVDMCLGHVHTSVTTSPKPAHNLLSLLRIGNAAFARYVLLWTSDYYSWYEAQHACMQLGMHLASISTEEEYNLVTGMLSGEGYGTEFLSEERVLTPCRMQFFLCMIHIGMQIKVGGDQDYDAYVCTELLNLFYRFVS